MQNHAWPTRRNIHGVQAVNAAMALVQDNRSAATVVGDALQRAFGHLKGSTKHAARAANSNDRSAENWFQAKACPQVPAFLLLAQQVPELNAAVQWLMQNGPAHPEAAALMAKMERIVAA
jgi:hypothetical protein